MSRVCVASALLWTAVLGAQSASAFPGPRSVVAGIKSAAAAPAPSKLSVVTNSNRLAAALALPPAANRGRPSFGDPEGRDAVLDWNAVLCAANANDHSGTFGSKQQGGPGRTARAFAIVHIAIYDAVNSIRPRAKKYLTQDLRPLASIDAAVAQAAHDTLVALYPAQDAVFDSALADYLSVLANTPSKAQGIRLGAQCAANILAARSNDGSQTEPTYTPGQLPGDHREDPLNPGQGFLNPGWGSVLPFALTSGSQFRGGPPPALDSVEYAVAFLDVQKLGSDGIVTPTQRTEEQTEIGLYWAYDGVINLGTPPRLYNQIATTIAEQQGNSEIENARLFALINIALADAGICCWESKYHYNFWRPILGIREANDGTGPSGLGDGNLLTAGDAGFVPLGAPASNGSNGGIDFTPGFPAYPSGHATFGASLFRTLSRFYASDEVPFTFVSDELNGLTTGSDATTVRPLSPRSFPSLSAAAVENARSRVYLGVHWQFDADAGLQAGSQIGDFVFENELQPVGR